MLSKPFKKCESYGVSTKSAIGLVGYDTALTRQGSRVRTPDRVVVFSFLPVKTLIHDYQNPPISDLESNQFTKNDLPI